MEHTERIGKFLINPPDDACLGLPMPSDENVANLVVVGSQPVDESVVMSAVARCATVYVVMDFGEVELLHERLGKWLEVNAA